MTSVLRLATLSYAIALVDASFLFWTDRDAGNGNWGPAKQTAGLTEIDPVGWTPKPTAPPGAKPLDLDLRRRQQTSVSSAATCGFPADNISAPAITCSNGEYCLAMQWQSVAGCCSESNRKDCRVPTTCVESLTGTDSTQPDSRTLVCDDPAKPRCVTYLYDADFFENLNGFSFLACGSNGEAASSTIGTTPPPGWLSTTTGSAQSTGSITSGPSTTGTDPTNAITITVFPGTSSSASSTPVAAATGGSGVSRTGAIVGGTIGGVAGLALILAAIFFFLRYRRRRGAGTKEVESSPPYPRRSYPAASVYPSGLPEPQYTSDFYGELPPQMAQSSTQHMTGYPPPNNFDHNYESSYEPHYEPVAVPRDIHRPTRPSTFVPGSPKPNEEDIVSPITPGDQLNPADDPATYTWISNPTPPPQSEYSQYSPPPPPQFQSYRPYPGT
ncbi:hypothetical protein F4821DRAFT_166962 [Hypoxylon rubiginosum]|uniref:Uncharacterized protein n=1 Tax=Hypoxylon rubiginosum TaxID=110542 RepID=A0ACC0CWG7_9PEZI|nr:hypothetical protein F4821DRAFT_166962 [Hypoxylon rubiginosum]